uniref:Chlororespiratory reduction 42 n=1 Tax=Geranium incanum TaxID=1158081 RepID=A0A0F7J4B4_9ROSI|nr:chlororespiratory reduction 42 [Geranium incanum]
MASFSLQFCTQFVPYSSKLQLRSCQQRRVWVRCESSRLEVGSPVIIVEAPRMIKTAASVPCLLVNSGLLNPGDVGRIVSRKPKDVWAVRLAIGTYLIDAKYFKPLLLDDGQH